MGVPGRFRQRQLKDVGKFFGDGPALIAKRCKRASRAAELKRERMLFEMLQAAARAMQRCGIFGKFQAERHRQRMLQPGARHDRGVAVLSRKPRKAGHCAVDVGQQRVDAGAQGQHGRGIDHVLAGRAPMHEAGGVLVGPGDLCRERLDERNSQIAGPRGSFGERCEIEGIGLAGLGNGLRSVRRNDAGHALAARQGHLEIEHELQVGAVIAHRAHGGA